MNFLKNTFQINLCKMQIIIIIAKFFGELIFYTLSTLLLTNFCRLFGKLLLKTLLRLVAARTPGALKIFQL